MARASAVMTTAGGTRRRVMVVAIAFGLVLLLGFAAFVLRMAENAIRRGAEAQVRSTAQLSARLVEEQSLRFGEVVSAYALRLQNLSHLQGGKPLQPDDLIRLDSTLAALTKNVEGIRAASITDASGRLVAREPPSSTPAGVDLSDRDWFRGAIEHSPYQSKAMVASIDKMRVTVESVLVKDNLGRRIGVLNASESGRAQKFADQYGKQLGAQVTVTDQAGQIVGRTGHPTQNIVSLAGDPLVKAALAGGNGVKVRTVNGRRAVSGYAAVPTTGWTVIADVPTSKAFADVPRLRVALGIGTGVVAILLLVLIPLLVSQLDSARAALGISEEFQRDLMPSSLPRGVRSHYVASERRMLLGGDFIDVVELPDGSLAVIIGDVCGHGPRAAALGSTIRAGWRTMATAGAPVERVGLLDQLVETARHDDDLFATIACAVIAPDGKSMRYAVAGHPPPLLVGPDGPTFLEDVRGPAIGLGLGPMADWPVGTHDLEPGWSLVLYTDGLIEARERIGRPRLGTDGLEKLVRDATRDGRLDSARLLKTIAATTEDPDDDIALLLIDGAATHHVAEPLS